MAKRPPKKKPARKSLKVTKLEQELERYKRQALVAERMRFEASRQRSSGKNKGLDARVLAAGVAHEFNNILGAADGHAEWALESATSGDMNEALKMVRLACKRSHQITRALQGIVQPREEKYQLFDLPDLVSEVKAMFGPFCQKANVTFACDVPKARLYGHYAQIEEIFINIIRNAAEALPKGGGHLSITGKLLKKRVDVAFTNSGPEIPEPYQKLIFQPFFTTKGAFKAAIAAEVGAPAPENDVQGTGLGLFLSRSIAEEHGGTLELDASFKGGTRFVLSLPLAR